MTKTTLSNSLKVNLASAKRSSFKQTNPSRRQFVVLLVVQYCATIVLTLIVQAILPLSLHQHQLKVSHKLANVLLVTKLMSLETQILQLLLRAALVIHLPDHRKDVLLPLQRQTKT